MLASVLALSSTITLNYDFSSYEHDRKGNDQQLATDVSHALTLDSSQVSISSVSSGSTVIVVLVPCVCVKCLASGTICMFVCVFLF